MEEAHEVGIGLGPRVEDEALELGLDALRVLRPWAQDFRHVVEVVGVECSAVDVGPLEILRDAVEAIEPVAAVGIVAEALGIEGRDQVLEGGMARAPAGSTVRAGCFLCGPGPRADSASRRCTRPGTKSRSS
jgi:hypothetical protein